jgi:predicted deacylase
MKLLGQIPRGGRVSAIDFYSPDYFAAKRRFVAACDRLGFERHSLPIDAPSPNGEPLTIDVALAGPPDPTRALVVSSGVHGVEGFFGSAVQLAFLEGLSPDWQPPAGAALIVMHALNPFGFAWQRRFNEDNVDLNRNFLLTDQQYAGAPPLCGLFRDALMKLSTPPRFGAAVRMARLALRHGVRSFWETLPVGQYEFPDWLFFGGSARSQTAKHLNRYLPNLFDRCEEVVHLDFHTGLGRWADCKLLLSEYDTADNTAWWRAHFGAAQVVAANDSAGRYQIRGGFGTWLKAQFPKCRYRFATAEFGTYSPMRVIGALANELHWHAKLGTQFPDHRARRRLTETFAPRSRRWRTRSLETGHALVQRAATALWPTVHSPAELCTAC